jgi:lipoyl-dependent peroxiredoxin subunit D
MTLDALIDSLPASAKDLKLNYSSLVRNNSELSQQQLWGTVVATTIATRSAPLTAAVLTAAPAQLSAQAFDAAKTVAAIMGMNNIWYRFHHLSSNAKYATMPARLRMSGLRGHGVEDADTELWALAVSAVNGCGKCVDAHEKTVREKGVTEETVAAAIRVASVIHAIGAVVDQVTAETSTAVAATV